MGKIVILDEITANKIAAGEVVERPASVIKELVENSIDAGATQISVDIKNGGISYIKVSDNGSGIDDDDMELAFERHATSKIRKADDLECISTMGFRGEALASIASVSNVELTTRPAHKEIGSYIKVSGGKFIDSKSIGCPVGTTFIIRDLFFNTPARYKFLKKDTTEATYVSDVLERIALSNPQIAFKFTSNGSVLLHTPGNNDLQSVVYSVYGRDVAQKVKAITYDDGKIKILGYAGKAEISRGNRNHQTIFINGRYIRSRIITAAIEEAYKTMLMKGRFAFCIISIEINPIFVDVNVHPTKMEVRFSDEQMIFRAVYHALQGALLDKLEISSAIKDIDNLTDKRNNQGFKIPNFNRSEYEQQPIESHNAKTVFEQPFNIETKKSEYKFSEHTFKKDNYIEKSHQTIVENESKDIFITNKKDESKPIYNKLDLSKVNETSSDERDAKLIYQLLEPLRDIDTKEEKVDINHFSEAINENIYSSYDSRDEGLNTEIPDVQGSDNIQKENNLVNIILENDDSSSKEKVNSNPILSDSIIIGQAFSTYIFLQKENELFLVDQHAAHERVLYEKIKRGFEQKVIHQQMLVMPEVFELTPHEHRIALSAKTFFNDLGFMFEDFGNNSIIVRSIPDELTESPFKQSFLDILDNIIANGEKDISLVAEEAIHTMACKAAIKANKRLDHKEIKELLINMEELFNPLTCPHGRPTVLKLTKYEVEKMFKRVGN